MLTRLNFPLKYVLDFLGLSFITFRLPFLKSKTRFQVLVSGRKLSDQSGDYSVSVSKIYLPFENLI